MGSFVCNAEENIRIRKGKTVGTKLEKEVKIEEEKQKLLKVFQFLPEAKMKVAKRIIERVAFMKVTLKTLEDTINTKGPTYLFENGSQKMEVEHPAQKSYNTMINRFTAANEKLLNLLPKDDEVPYVANSLSEEVDDFENF